MVYAQGTCFFVILLGEKNKLISFHSFQQFLNSFQLYLLTVVLRSLLLNVIQQFS